MIRKNVQYGNIEIPVLAEFGSGDIAVGYGYNIDHVALTLVNINSQEIGTKITNEKQTTTNDIKPDILFGY